MRELLDILISTQWQRLVCGKKLESCSQSQLSSADRQGPCLDANVLLRFVQVLTQCRGDRRNPLNGDTDLACAHPLSKGKGGGGGV